MGVSSSKKYKRPKEKNSPNDSLLTLLLLSLTKIQDFKSYFEKYSEIYQNQNKLIQIFIDLIKNEKSVDDIVNKNKKLLMNSNNPLIIKKFYKSKLNELNKQLEEVNKNKSNAPSISIIRKLFWGKKKKISECSICKKTKSSEKEKIIFLSFDLADIDDNFDASEKLSVSKKSEKKDYCEIKDAKANFKITYNYDLPNIILMILYNSKKRTKIKYALSKETLGFKYELICFITQYVEMVFKEANNQWYHYSNKDKENREIEMNQNEIVKYHPIVFFYQKFEKKINFHEAITEYLKLQNEIENLGNNQIKKLYLVPIKFFDKIFELIDINLNMNAINDIEKKIEEKKNELMSLEQLEIIDYNSYKKNFTFVNEKILDNLGIKKEEYENKQIQLNKTDKNKFIVTFDNQVSIGIKKEGKQIKILSINNNFHINNSTDIKIFFDHLSNIFSLQKNISKSIEENKIDENKMENYYIINVKWFYKLIKIFESDEIYEDDNYKIDSFDKITNIRDLNEKDLKVKNDLFLKRKKILSDENLFKVEYEEKSGIKYPNKFVIIKDNHLNDLLKEFKISFKNIQSNIYQIFYGEHYIFIRDNINKNKYLVCSQKYMEINAELIFNFRDDKYFKSEINKFIKNRNGFIYYFKERNIKINNSQIQNIINKEHLLIGNIIIINNIINDNHDNANDNNNEKLNQEIIQDCCPYIKSLFLSLLTIKNLKDFFINNQILSQNNKISILLSNFIRSFQNDKKQLQNIIINAKNEIQNLNEVIIKNPNFKDLIDCILTNLHQELNANKNVNNDFCFEDHDKGTNYQKLKDKFYAQNDSIISKLFFNEIEKVSKCQKCKMSLYSFDICKYLYFDIKKQNKVSLNYLFNELETRTTYVKKFCKICMEDSLDMSENQKLNLCSEILIIVLNNEDNAEIEYKENLNYGNINYNLICCIMKSTIDNNFNVLFPSNQKWYQFQNDFNENEEKKYLRDFVWNPTVLIYAKVDDNNTIISNQENSLRSIGQNTSERRFNNEIEKMKELREKGNQKNNQTNNQSNNIQNNNMSMNNNQINKNQINTNQMNNNQMNNMQMNNNQMNNNQMNNNQINNNQMNNNQMNNMQMNNNQMNNQMNNNQIYNQVNNNQMYNNQINNNQMNNNQMNNNYNQNNFRNNNMNLIYMRNNNNNNVNNRYNQLLNNGKEIIMNNNISNNINNGNNVKNNYKANNMNNMHYSMNNNNFNHFNINNNNINNMQNNIINSNNMIHNNMNNNFKSQQINNNFQNNNNYCVFNNNNNQKNYNNNNYNIISEDKNENNYITLYFQFSNNKQIYIDVKSTSYFRDVISELREKYSWLNDIQIIDYKYNGKSIEYNKTLQENHIKDSSLINIINC